MKILSLCKYMHRAITETTPFQSKKRVRNFLKTISRRKLCFFMPFLLYSFYGIFHAFVDDSMVKKYLLIFKEPLLSYMSYHSICRVNAYVCTETS
jgi:hypothetical protein